jgi:hypothetical protein
LSFSCERFEALGDEPMHSLENELDTFRPIGETFVLVVGAICPKALEFVLATAGGDCRQLVTRREEEERVTGNFKRRD